MSLSDSGKLAFLFLLSSPHMTSLGAMRATVAGLAAELRWTPAKLKRAIDELTNKKMVEFDRRANFLCLPNFLRYNPPESPNVIRSWARSLDSIPECNGRRRVVARAAHLAEGLPEGFRKEVPEVFLKFFGIQEQEQEQEQEQGEENSAPAGARRPRRLTRPAIPPDLAASPGFAEVWNRRIEALPPSKRPTPDGEAIQLRRAQEVLQRGGPAFLIGAVEEAISRKWTGFEIDWLSRKPPATGALPSSSPPMFDPAVDGL